MSSPQDRESALFALVAEKPVTQRAALLEAVCAGDPVLRRRLEALLAAHGQPETLLATRAEAVGFSSSAAGAEDAPAGPARSGMESDPAPAADEPLGLTLGRYRLLERLGEGGCGVVYVAEQTEPVRRRVALKVIKLGMDTRQVVARFEAERQALAMMDHPNIAKVLDAGTTDTGRPYFVMELVRGIRITDYCDQANLSTPDRLDLFIKVCQAIQHAHQKGIIHRDIKPSNILVTLHDGVPVPKVIDFGIAKATEGRLTEATIYTQLHQFVGTPAYMSPEQAEMSGLDIDTRSDIYSLGVLLYELLAGSPPFDPKELMASGLDGMRKTIREQEPPRPSTRLATLGAEQLTTTARRRSVETSKLVHQLRGDLDWIVMKCLEKDRQRRYETANGLAADIRRHLDNEPVVARPPSAAYRFQKAFRRNKLLYASGFAVTGALVLGVVISAWQAVRATQATRAESRQRLVAETAQAQAQAKQHEAEVERSRAESEKQRAEAAELAARRRAYASDMNVAREALAESNLGRALDLLNRQRPQPGQEDLRGWEWRYLWKQTRSDAVFTLCQEPAEVSSLAASPDGHWLAVGSFHQGGVAVWDWRSRQEVARLAKEEFCVHSAFAGSEPMLAFASSSDAGAGEQRHTLRLWNVAERRMLAEVPLDNPCRGLAFAGDGRTLVTSTRGGHITVWQVPAGIPLASYPSEQGGEAHLGRFAATPDLTRAAYSLDDGRIRAVDLCRGTELWTVQASGEFITALAFSPDGRTLGSAAGFTESDIRLWDAATGKPLGRLEGHRSWVASLAFWPDGRKLASCSADQTLRIWDVDGRKCLDVLRGHRQEVWRLALLPDGRTLVSGGKDGTVCFWDASSRHARPSPIVLPTHGFVAAGFASDGQSILTLDRKGQVSQWAGSDYRLETSLVEVGELDTGSKHVSLAAFSDDGRFLAAGRANGTIEVWDVAQRALRQRLTQAPGPTPTLKFLPDGGRLITWSSRNNALQEWDLRTGLERQSWPAPLSVFFSLAVSPDGRECIALGWGGEFVLRHLGDQTQRCLNLGTLESFRGSYSPDGTVFAIASGLGHGQVWDARTWEPLATLRGFLNAPHSVAFSADGKRLVLGGNGAEAVKLWARESWQEVLTLAGEGTGTMGVLGFSPDGRTITWGSQTSGLHVWQAPSWEEIAAAEAKDLSAGVPAEAETR